MSEEQQHPDEASRLTAAREQADRGYREALAAVDHAVPKLFPIPSAPLPEVDQQSPATILRLPIIGWRMLSRLAARVRGRVQREIGQVTWSFAAKSEEMHALARFHFHVIQYLQQVYPLIETRYRHQMMIDSGLAASVDEVNAVYALRWEATQTRERRMVAALDEIRTSIAVVQQTGATLKRELERLLPLGQAAANPATGTLGSGERIDLPTSAARPAASPDALNAYKYVGFEQKFRGSEDDIAERLAGYLPLFEGASDVLDLGCGRGEFLATLGDHGISGRGIDLNHEMVELCRSRGLTVEEGDALAYLEGLPDGSLGGLFAAQVVEHFQPGYLMRLLDVAFHALRPGSRLVLETINPACWSAFFDSYIRDVTHAWPLHPDTLSFLVTAAGFQRTEVRYMAPYSPDHKLQRVSARSDAAITPAVMSMIETFNANVDRLNSQLFSNRDYAVIAERL
ncbi:MAG: methyltransferase domain-containing protein [Acidobacteria bacterium]|nr:methyltransferase domain-containing protein [Acidobacteriota bacterium]